MFGIGWTEFIVIALFLLVFVGPKHLPHLLGKIASLLSQFREASRDLRNQLDMEIAEIRDVRNEIKDDLVAKADELYREAREAKEEVLETNTAIKAVAKGLRSDLEDSGAPPEKEERGEEKRDIAGDET